MADAFPGAFQDWHCEVTALELVRTFWEKATILHAEHYRPAELQMPDRYARHYADMARLLSHEAASVMLGDTVMRARVVDWKQRLFARQWARYDLAVAGRFRLQPADSRRVEPARDYAEMRPMFLTPPPVFDEVIEQLAAAERMLNAEGSESE